MSEADVDRDQIREHPAAANEPEAETQGEMLKFGILAGVLLATVLVIALLRPYIFTRIIPAVLGEGRPSATIINTETEAETIKPDSEVEEGNTETADDVEESNAITEEAAEENTAAGEEPEAPEDFPTAVPAQSHTVQAGETLTAIARRYGVSVQTLVRANSISNPDRVAVGAVLIIPENQ